MDDELSMSMDLVQRSTLLCAVNHRDSASQSESLWYIPEIVHRKEELEF